MLKYICRVDKVPGEKTWLWWFSFVRVVMWHKGLPLKQPYVKNAMLTVNVMKRFVILSFVRSDMHLSGILRIVSVETKAVTISGRVVTGCVRVCALLSRMPVSFLHSLNLLRATFASSESGAKHRAKEEKVIATSYFLGGSLIKWIISWEDADDRLWYVIPRWIIALCCFCGSLIVQLRCKIATPGTPVSPAPFSQYNSTVVFHEPSLFSTIKNSLSCCPQTVVVVFGILDARKWGLERLR